MKFLFLLILIISFASLAEDSLDKEIEKRLAGAGIEIAAAWQHYKYMVINDDLEQAVNEIADIIKR